MRTGLTQERVRDLLDYDPETGIFTWKNDKFAFGKARCCRAGDVAGGRNVHGYWQICIDYRVLLAHRLAWLYVTGQWPDGQIDHVNGDKADNRFENLRVANNSENMRNRRRYSNNRSGLKGVSFSKVKNCFRASIQVDNKWKHLGYFNCPTAAHLAYCRAAKALHGEFARSA
jgi:hypothetical protein